MSDLFGFLNINKPRGITSHDVVDIIRKSLGIKKVGHTGTLDPLASGVLVLAIGKATRLIEYLVEGEKVYVATLKLGLSSDTFDTEGKVKKLPYSGTTRRNFATILEKFIGEIQQTPPPFSAIKVKGKPAYKMARKDSSFTLPKRKVHIQDIKLLEFSDPHAKIEVTCNKGTYIRSLVHDIGLQLDTDAVLTDLQRTSNSGFHLKNSVSLDNIDSKTLLDNLISPFDIFKDDSIEIQDDVIPLMKWGKSIPIDSDKEKLFLFDKDQRLICVASKKGDFYHPHKVFV